MKAQFPSIESILTKVILNEANRRAESNKNDYHVFKENGFFGVKKNGLEWIPAVHDNHEDLADEWFWLEQQEGKEVNQTRSLTSMEIKEDEATQAQRAMYEGFDEECGF